MGGMKDKSPGETLHYTQVGAGGSYEMTEEGMATVLPSGNVVFVDKREILILRDMCNNYMSKFGAVDWLNREVIDKESGNG